MPRDLALPGSLRQIGRSPSLSAALQGSGFMPISASALRALLPGSAGPAVREALLGLGVAAPRGAISSMRTSCCGAR